MLVAIGTVLGVGRSNSLFGGVGVTASSWLRPSMSRRRVLLRVKRPRDETPSDLIGANWQRDTISKRNAGT